MTTYRKPREHHSRLTPYKSEPDLTRWSDYRCKTHYWRAIEDARQLLLGVYRPLREMDDADRAAAYARLDMLLSGEASHGVKELAS